MEQLKALECHITKKIRMTYYAEFAKSAQEKEELNRNSHKFNASINALLRGVTVTNTDFKRINDSAIKEVERLMDELFNEHFNCVNCHYSHMWPNGTKISVDDMGQCTRNYEADIYDSSKDVSSCFKPYRPKEIIDYKTKLLYLKTFKENLKKKR
jgi:hypothetical protein